MQCTFRWRTVLGAAIALAITVSAQAQTLRVTAEKVNVRQKPTTDSAVVATLDKGSELESLEKVGAWYRVRIKGTGSEGYVHSLVVTAVSSITSTTPSSVPTILPGAQQTGSSLPEQRIPGQRVAPLPAPPPAGNPLRQTGVGGRVGGFTMGVGGSIRHWANDRFAMQFTVSTHSESEESAIGGVRAVGGDWRIIQIAPSLIYRVTEPKLEDDIVLTPYVGGGMNIFRSRATARVAVGGQSEAASESATNLGFQVFGGVEAWVTQARTVAVSADLGYYSSSTPFSNFGYRIGGFAWSASLHYYLK